MNYSVKNVESEWSILVFNLTRCAGRPVPTFEGNKDNKQWLWLALNPTNRRIVAFYIGGRGVIDAQLFYEKIPTIFKDKIAFFLTTGKPMLKFFKMRITLGWEKTVV